MIAAKKAVDIFLVFVLFPMAALLLVSIVIAVNATAVAVYVGALLAVWLLFAFVLPLTLGMMAPDELLSRIRSVGRGRSHFEGEPLPSDNPSALWMRWSRGEPEMTP